ncbi:GGDEF domain-containing protein [Haploplasma axanthum]|uniref:Diguanylate cyclase YdeH n=1 Tax=Haploplasma axanthum TaxID=29552 RepID=A0A449BFN2_HAPAX|nr:GGDEF domain-containing protein [Haploplasma axanthum]VEU81253.1 Diguanylate cyclase YdeH [Haploplasma axanthum]
MKNEYFLKAQERLKNEFGLNILDDLILDSKERVFLFSINVEDDIEFTVMLGNLEILGLENKNKIMLSELLNYFDFNNDYARVLGKKEAFKQLKDFFLENNKAHKIVFPILVNNKRYWINAYQRPVSKNSKINYCVFSEISKSMSNEEIAWYNSHIDPLTGLYNKYTFDYHYNIRYTNENLHVIYLDVDNLKKINDTYGHKIGDQVLIELASVLKKYETEYNHFYRIGGDEFLGLIFMDEIRIKELLQKILDEIMKKIFSDEEIKVTISIGVVRALQRKNLVDKADKLLYKAKNQGKNGYVYEIEGE